MIYIKKFFTHIGLVALVMVSVTSPAISGGPADTVGIRLEATPRFERISFQWRRMVDYVVFQNDAQVSIVFDSQTPIADQTSITRSSTLIETAVQHRYQNKVEILFSLMSGVRIRHFRKGPEIVIDILAPRPSIPSTSAANSATASIGLPVPLPPAATN